MKSKPEIFLKTLLAGYVVTIKGQEYQLSEDNELCVKVTVYTSTGTGTVRERHSSYRWVATDFTLKQFINICYKIPDDDITIMVANKVLNETKRRKA